MKTAGLPREVHVWKSKSQQGPEEWRGAGREMHGTVGLRKQDDSEVRALTTLAEDASSVPSSHTGELTTAWGFSSRKEAHTQLSWKGVGF